MSIIYHGGLSANIQAVNWNSSDLLVHQWSLHIWERRTENVWQFTKLPFKISYVKYCYCS